MENSSDIDVYFNEKLHAKCYMNEDTAIITSMNLYEASEKNRELGVLIQKIATECCMTQQETR